MTTAKEQAPDAAAEATEGPESLLDSILGKVDVVTPGEKVSIVDFKDQEAVAEKDKGAMMSAALQVFVEAISKLDQPLESIDKNLVDSLIAGIDAKLSSQLNEVMHAGPLQKLESSWRGLKLLVDRTDFRKNVKIDLLNASKDDLRESFEDAPELIQSALYKHVYTAGYDQAGADPYGAIITDYEFENNPQDIALLRDASKVAAGAHCPFISSVGHRFFGKDSMEDWKKIPDLRAHMETSDYVKWNSFRETEDSRYCGLVFPRYMSRLPYGPDTVKAKTFNYVEDVKGYDHDKYLWGNASFLFGANLSSAFADDGWCVQIRGPQSGGRVSDLPIHAYDVGKGTQLKFPTEVKISDAEEFDVSDLGFIPAVVYEGKDYAVFFSANSTQKPVIYDDSDATSNSRINSRLPYIFLASRIAHYLKVQQRENIGSSKPKAQIQAELQNWLDRLVTKMNNPSARVIAKHPLKAAEVTVVDVEGNPGFYQVRTMIQPHFQVEGLDISLSLVGKLPSA